MDLFFLPIVVVILCLSLHACFFTPWLMLFMIDVMELVLWPTILQVCCDLCLSILEQFAYTEAAGRHRRC